MKSRYRLYKRTNGMFYARDTETEKQKSLQTKNRTEGERLVAAMNQAADTPQLNRAMAKVYASAASPNLMTRTWGEVMEAYAKKSRPSSQKRVDRAFRSVPFKVLRGMKVNETDADAFHAVIEHKRAGNSTNHYLRRLQNYAWGMRWLFEPVIPTPLWPKITKKTTYAITAEEHEKIIASEQNPEHRRYYQMLWETGGSQTDIANLSWDRVKDGTITFYRAKVSTRVEDNVPCGLSQLAIGHRIRNILDAGPQDGYFFPSLRLWSSGHRTTEFARRCRLAGVVNRQLKGYRYAWAERACAAGMPEREAMKHLGHKSPAVHRVYSEKANALILPLEHYESLKKAKIHVFSSEHEPRGSSERAA